MGKTKTKDGEFDYTGLDIQLAKKHKNKTFLNKDLNISWDTIANFSKGKGVTLTILKDICIALECDIGDIVSIKKGPGD